MLSPDDPRYARIHRIIVSQAVTGESVGIEHYAKMIALCPGLPERLALLEDAWRERHHLVAVQDAAREMGLTIEDGRDDPYWSRIRAAFDECAARGDLIACHMVQDVVLECFAVTLYRCLVGRVDPALAGRFERIAADEEQHLRHGLDEARRAFDSDPEGTFARMEFANERVARVLAEWIRPEDCQPVCGVCGKVGGGCAKPDLEALQLDLIRMRADFVSRYGAVLREAGVAPATVTRWVARLFA